MSISCPCDRNRAIGSDGSERVAIATVTVGGRFSSNDRIVR